MSGADRSMVGKVCMVTGATSGIGEVTAGALARRGATVVVVGRDRAKTEATVDRIRREADNPDVEPLLADLSVRAEVHRLAGEFRERHDRLHVLVNNAGAAFGKRTLSADGVEMTFALDHLGYFLLTNLLLDVLKASAPARIINVASDAHRTVRGITFDDLARSRRYGSFRVYSEAKLANVLFTAELARRLEGTGVIANALHPGLVATNFGANMGRGARFFFRLFGLSPAEGARTMIYLATSPEVEGVSGRYFVKERERTPSPAARDEAAAARLWEWSESVTGLAAPAAPASGRGELG